VTFPRATLNDLNATYAHTIANSVGAGICIGAQWPSRLLLTLSRREGWLAH
jgi:hypothetical protein